MSGKPDFTNIAESNQQKDAEEDVLEFELGLPELHRLRTIGSSADSGSLRCLRDALTSGIDICLATGRQRAIAKLVDDFRLYQRQWAVDGLVSDSDGVCSLRLCRLSDKAHIMMLANKVNFRLLEHPGEQPQEGQLSFYRSDSQPAGGGPDSQHANSSVVKYANTLQELIGTEENYVRRLRLLHEHYYPRLRGALTAPEGPLARELGSVFSLYATFCQMHLELLAELRAAEASRQMLVGQIMCKYGHMLRLYSDYYVNYKRHTQLLDDCMKDEAFRRACETAQRDCPDQLDRRLDITSHMIEPIQRPLRYPLLINSYLKEIDASNPDRERAQRALQLIEQVTNNFDSKVAELESYQQLQVHLRDLVIPAELLHLRDTFVKSTFLLSARVLKISSKNRQQIRHLLLSSSALLLCEAGPLNRRTVQRGLRLDEGDLAVSVDAKLSADYPNSLRLHTRAKTYDLSFASTNEFDQWVTALRKLDVTFADEAAVATADENFPWAAMTDEDLGRKPPMKVKDNDVSQCQACSTAFTALLRRHHCRLCGGIFCAECSDYTSRVWWSAKEKRCCCFCKDRLCRRDGAPDVVQLALHRDLIDRRRRQEEKEAAPVLPTPSRSSPQQQPPPPAVEKMQGYLRVRVDAPDGRPRYSWCPAELLGRWRRLWCSFDGQLLRLYRMKRDAAPVHKVVLPMEVTVALAAAESEILLSVKDGAVETGHLRLDDATGVNGQLEAWFRCLSEASKSLQRTMTNKKAAG